MRPRFQQPERSRLAIATFRSYEEAERAVDYLSDHGFPVERSAIVGRDLEYVEQVTLRRRPRPLSRPASPRLACP